MPQTSTWAEQNKPKTSTWAERNRPTITPPKPPSPPKPTTPIGKSHGWLIDQAYNYINKIPQIATDMWEGMPFKQQNKFFEEAGKDPAAFDTANKELEQQISASTRSPYDLAKSGLNAVDPTGASTGYLGLGEMAVEDWKTGNIGGLGMDVTLAAAPWAIGKYAKGRAASRLANTGPQPESPYNVPHPPSPYNVPRPDYNVPRPRSPYDVPNAPAPYDVPFPPNDLFNVEGPIGPSSRYPQLKLPERAGMGTQDLYPRGPRTPELKGLGPGTPFRDTPFRASEIGGQPVMDVRDPSNIGIFGQGIDVSQQAQGFSNIPVQPGFNPALRRPSTAMPVGKPIMDIPPLPEVLPVETPIPAGAKTVKPVVQKQPKVTLKAPPKEPVKKIKDLTDDELIAKAAAEPDAATALLAELNKRTAKAAKAASKVTIVPDVEPPKVEIPKAVAAIPESTLPKIEPVPVPELKKVPDVKPIVEPVKVAKTIDEMAGDLTPEQIAAIDKASTKASKLTAAIDVAKVKYQKALRKLQEYRSPLIDASTDPKLIEINQKLNDARKELKASTDAKKPKKEPKAVTPALPKVEPIVEPTLPKVEPIDDKLTIREQVKAQHYAGPDLKAKSIEELREIARTADDNTSAAIRQEFVRRRKAASSNTLASGFGSLQDAPRILKAEFDQWRVLKELPENQASYEKFLRDTSRIGTAATRVGKGETVELPLEGLKQFEKDRAAIGTSAKQPDWQAQSRVVDRPRELPTERVMAGTVEKEGLKGLSLKEIQAKVGAETKARDKASAIEAAFERGRQNEIFERQRAKTTAKVVARQERLKVRDAKIAERKAKVADKKAAKVEVAPAEIVDVPEEKIVNKIGRLRFLKANPKLKDITDRMIKWRAADKLIGKGIRDKFKHIADIPKEEIIPFQEALGRGKYPEVRKFFDDMHDDLTSRGIEMGEKANYLPQLWDNTAKEVQAAFGDKKMSEKASFQFRSFIEDYKTGIKDKNLTPKMSPIELIEWYGRRANKLIADNRALKELKAAGYISKGRRFGTEAMDENLGTFKYHYADPKVKDVIENYLKGAETKSGFGHALGKAAGKLTSTALSAGVPKVPLLTFHGGNIAWRSLGEGRLKRVGQAVKFGLSPKRAVRHLEENNQLMIDRTQEFGASFGTEDIPDMGDKFFTKPEGSFGRGKAKKAFNWLTDKQHDWFEKNLFEKMLPALKHTAWEDNFAQFQKKGMSREKAGAAATEVTDDAFSGRNIDLLYHNKNFNTAVRVLTLAPNWLRSTLALGYKVPASAVKILKDPKNPVTQKYLKTGATMAATYAAANLVQKGLTGKYMVENSTSDLFNLQFGEDSEGRPRSVKLFNTAADFFKVPFQAAMAGFREGGTGETLASAAEYRASPLVSILGSIKTGENFRGETNIFGTKDTFGRPVPFKDRARNTLSQVLGYGPPQISAPIDYLMGKAGGEETISRLLELPLKYGRKKKRKESPLGGPNISLKGLQ